jgi:hypothetical protein
LFDEVEVRAFRIKSVSARQRLNLSKSMFAAQVRQDNSAAGQDPGDFKSSLMRFPPRHYLGPES